MSIKNPTCDMFIRQLATACRACLRRITHSLSIIRCRPWLESLFPYGVSPDSTAERSSS